MKHSHNREQATIETNYDAHNATRPSWIRKMLSIWRCTQAIRENSRVYNMQYIKHTLLTKVTSVWSQFFGFTMFWMVNVYTPIDGG